MKKLNKNEEMKIVGGVRYAVNCYGNKFDPPYTSHYTLIEGESPNVDVAIAQYNYNLSIHKSVMSDSSHSAKPY